MLYERVVHLVFQYEELLAGDVYLHVQLCVQMIYTPFKNADVKSIFKITGSASAETSSVIAK